MQALSDQDHRFVQAPWRGSGSGRKGAAQGNRRRAHRGHHEVFGERSGFHQRLGTGDRPMKRSSAGLPAAAVAARGLRRIERTRRLALHAAGAQLHRGDDVSGRSPGSASRSGAPTTPRAPRSGPHRQSRAARQDSGTAQGKGQAARLPRLSRTWCSTTAWPTPAHARKKFLDDLRVKTEQRFREENRRAGNLRRHEAGALGRRLLGRKAARRAVRFRRRSAAAVLPSGSRGGRDVRDLRPHLRHSRERREQACPSGIPR